MLASEYPPCPQILNIFTDASFPGSNTSRRGPPSTRSKPAGVAPWPVLKPQDWHYRDYQLIACRNCDEAELVAIVAGLENAILPSRFLPELERVSIFPDSQAAIHKLISAENFLGDPLVRRAVDASAALDGIAIRTLVRWCPGHAGIGGNERADLISKEVRNYALKNTSSGATEGDDEVRGLG
ncbi:hypothetical protein CCHL11_09658 [Colletotrichum chlorophyti]|uniref:RNase H type-1 domain-containing protein n=1 Tax=Colletotrichum chlorophyti TaxID=708187 RepID=A0A1Q8RFJ2_9PEZI|nr:hypothetical protein CCHL11_09658 [Colletotrichum chlorophyti]